MTQNWQETSKKLTNIFDDFLGFVHFMPKKHRKVSKSSDTDKNCQEEYQTINSRQFLLRPPILMEQRFLDTIGPST